MRLSIGTRVRSRNWGKPYGHIIDWDESLKMVVIRWEGKADFGPECCSTDEFEVIE